MNYLIVVCIVLFAIVLFQAVKVGRLSKNLKESGLIIEDKNEIIAGYRYDLNLERAKSAELKSQVTRLVSEINKVGLKRDSKGRFVSAD